MRNDKITLQERGTKYKLQQAYLQCKECDWQQEYYEQIRSRSTTRWRPKKWLSMPRIWKRTCSISRAVYRSRNCKWDILERKKEVNNSNKNWHYLVWKVFREKTVWKYRVIFNTIFVLWEYSSKPKPSYS